MFCYDYAIIQMHKKLYITYYYICIPNGDLLECGRSWIGDPILYIAYYYT